MWSDCLLDLGMDFLIGSMVFVAQKHLHVYDVFLKATRWLVIWL